MIVSRMASIILRIAQFVFAGIVLGLTAYFLHARTSRRVGRYAYPYGGSIFSVVWASLSVLFAIAWSIPTTSTLTGYVSDFFFAIGWAAVFGVLIQYFNGANCGSAWNWNGFSLSRGNYCGQFRAAQAFSFLSMIVWLATAVLGLLVVHRLSRRADRSRV